MIERKFESFSDFVRRATDEEATQAYNEAKTEREKIVQKCVGDNHPEASKKFSEITFPNGNSITEPPNAYFYIQRLGLRYCHTCGTYVK